VRATLCGVVGLVALTVGVTPASAHSRFHHDDRHATNWTQRDTAIYVVSTLNLLRTHRGHTIPDMLQHRFGVRSFDVFADTQATNLYYIELDKSSGETLAAFAYQLGWMKPVLVYSHVPLPPIVHSATVKIIQSYQTDKKTLIGDFNSTTPTTF